MHATPRGPGEALGYGLGLAIAPLFALGSWLRRGRVFHPHGECYSAQVFPADDVPRPFDALARRLSGAALLRLSSSLWREPQRFPDLLGCAIRFSGARPPPRLPDPDMQDLLLLSTTHLWRLPLDAWRTNTRDFLANAYHAIAPFEAEGRRRLKLRLVPAAPSGARGRDRYENLRRAVEQDRARFNLQIRNGAGARRWITLLEIRLDKRLKREDEATRFSPFCTGMGLRPHGFIQFLRPWTYALSEFVRTRWYETHAGADTRATAGRARRA